MPVQILPVVANQLRARIFRPCIFWRDCFAPLGDQLRLERSRAAFGLRQFRHVVGIDEMHINELAARGLAAMHGHDVPAGPQSAAFLGVDGNNLVFLRESFQDSDRLTVDVHLGVFVVMNQDRRFVRDRIQCERLPKPDIVRGPDGSHAGSWRAARAETAGTFRPSGVVKVRLAPVVRRTSKRVSPIVDDLLRGADAGETQEGQR